MRPEKKVEEAAERAAGMQNRANDRGSRYNGMTYEDGLRDALDWVCEHTGDDPTDES